MAWPQIISITHAQAIPHNIAHNCTFFLYSIAACFVIWHKNGQLFLWVETR
jgi:hypothetical protein